jgi:hypothetical protein
MVAITLLVTVLAAPAATGRVSEPAGGDLDAKILAVDAGITDTGSDARVLFSSPSGLATRTLTDEDVEIQVDGEPQAARVRRLSASDLEIALIIDTAAATDELRTLQAAAVEFALTLPQGATMRIVDAAGNVSRTAPVPGPAIAAIRALRSETSDDIAAAVGEATSVLDASPRGRTALLVVGRDLANRLDVVDDRSLRSLSYLISIGSDQATDSLLGPRAPGETHSVNAPGEVLAVTDDIARDLRMLYVAQVTVPAGAQAITFAINAQEGASPATTLALDAGSLRPATVTPGTAEQPDAGQPDGEQQPDAAGPPVERQPEARQPQAPSSGDAGTDEWAYWWLALIGAAVAVIAVLGLRALLGRRTSAALPVPLPPLPPARIEAPQRRRATQSASESQRPIVKLEPETRQALARAHHGLRQLALASREAVNIVSDDLFRLTEARASAALSGYDRPLATSLHAAVSNETERGSVVVQRAAKALSAGWQHTARQKSAPPAVVEMNALLSGNSHSRTSNRRTPVPVAPVRALNPLVDIGLEHMVLVAQPDEYAALAARAVTVVDIMRAARLARPVLAISPYLLTDVERYRAACRADPADAMAREAWLEFLCDGIAERSYIAIDQLHRLRRLRAQFRDSAPNMLAVRLLDLLLAHPVVTAPFIAKRLVVPEDQAHAATAAAEDAGWLTPYPNDADAWVADDVLDVFG